jgi:hypothetical protein
MIDSKEIKPLIRYIVFGILPVLFLICSIILLLFSIKEYAADDESKVYTSKAVVSSKTQGCITCHTEQNPAIVASWHTSSHAEKGIGCYECHKADSEDADGFEHYGGNRIAVIVSPKDCGHCHATETEQFLGSIHAKAGEILGSLDNYLGEVVEGVGATISGCQQCHGSKVRIENGKLTAETWPNFGIGRINPDGTTGACTACHARHDFTRVQARTPEACGKCHRGPDHPQKEVYEESDHYITYIGHQDKMNLNAPIWIVGIDYTAAPTCATCHMAATLNQPRTHNIGHRLSWNNRMELSQKTAQWKDKRTAMKDVCHSCHNPNYVNNFYQQYDVGIELYNEKFARPAKDIIEKLQAANVTNPTPFNEDIEWTYYFLWHYEGRETRNGLAMMGPNYVQWHGFSDLARLFYMEFIPESERLLPGVTKEIMARPEHEWFLGQMSPEERTNMIQYYKEKYQLSQD